MEPQEGHPLWGNYVYQPPRQVGKTYTADLNQHMVQSVAAAKDLAGIHEAVAAWQREKDRMEAEQTQRKRERLMRHYSCLNPADLHRVMTQETKDQQEKDAMTTSTHNDTLTALHVKQGTKFCAVNFLGRHYLADKKTMDTHRENAVNQTYGGKPYTYKHAMDLALGSIVLTPTGAAIVTALDVAPTFGEGVDYKWVVADVTDSVAEMHALQDRERKAVEAMAVSAAMSAADKVLEKMGVAVTDKAVALLGGEVQATDAGIDHPTIPGAGHSAIIDAE